MAQSTAPAERDVVAYVELLRRTSEPLGLVLHGETPVNVCALPIHCFLRFSQSEDQISVSRQEVKALKQLFYVPTSSPIPFGFILTVL